MEPGTREVINRPGVTVIRYKPVPLKVERVYPWGTDEPAARIEKILP